MLFSEHFRLMKAADIFSMGNWDEIADKINNDGTEETGPSTNWKKRTGQEAMEEYERVFVQGPLGRDGPKRKLSPRRPIV
jgi:hypothetical protein